MSKVRNIKSKELNKLAGALDTTLEEIYEIKMGFMLVCSPFSGQDDSGVADYIGNSERETAIKWLRETANRLEEL